MLETGIAGGLPAALQVAGLCLVVALAGAVVAGRLAPLAPWTMRLGWGWILGTVATTFSAFGLLLLGLPIQLSLVAPVGALFAFRRGMFTSPPIFRMVVARIALAAVFLSVLGLALSTTAPEWDGMAIWGDKARRIVTEGTIGFEVMKDPVVGSAHPEYPLHVPLRAAVFASVSGGWSEVVMPLATAFDLLAIFLLLLGVLESSSADTGRRTLVFAALLVVPMPMLEIPAGYADLTVAAALLGTVLALQEWLRQGAGAGLLALAAGCAATAHWSKQEGLLFAVLVGMAALVLAAALRRRWIPIVWWAVVVAASTLPWTIARTLAGFELEPFGLRGLDQLTRLPAILRALAASFLDLRLWGPAFLVIVAVVLFRAYQVVIGRSGSRPSDLAGLFVLLALATITLVYVATPRGLEWHLATSLNRLLLQVVPVGYVFAASVLAAPATSSGRSATGSVNEARAPLSSPPA